MGGQRRFNPRQDMLVQSYEVFHYQDAALESVPAHHHDFYELYFFLSGNVQYNIEGRAYTPLPGDLLLVNPLEIHQLRVLPGTEPYERMVLWVNRAYLEGLAPGSGLARCFGGTGAGHTNLLRLNSYHRAGVSAKLEALVAECEGAEYASEAAAKGILLQLMVQVNRIALEATAKPAKGEETSPLVEGVLAYVNEHFGEALSLDELAARFYVSKYYLSHEFSRVTGSSLYRYIMLKRLVNAKQMLAAGEAATTACLRCGFKDYANFYRSFKAEYGISPGAFARQARQ